MPICASCGQENPDVAKFCLACGSPIEVAAPTAPAEERKLITAVFCDLVGSTARSESLDIEDVKELVSPYHARVRGELEAHGGTFEKFSGDAILALFGTPRAHEDDPERAIRGALAVRHALADLNAEDEWLDLHFRIGINTGEALVMLGARPSEGEWSAAGDVMNTAARIESAAPVDGILVGEQTYRATRDLFEFREAEPIAAKGKAEPVSVWEVVAARADGGPRVRTEAPLVGREAELARASEFCDRMLASPRTSVVTLLGPPGIGKSRLLLELTRRLAERCDVFAGRCLSYGEGITYWPIEEILKSAAGILQDDDEAAASAKLGSLIGALDTTDRDELRTIAAALANLIGAERTPLGAYSAASIGQAELHWGLRRLLELRAQSRPLAIVVEDLHWAEPTLLELLSYILETETRVPLLLLTTARPEVVETGLALFASDANRLTIELDALSTEDGAALVSALLPAGLDESSVAALLESAAGNPLFLEETVRMLAETGPPADGDGAALPVPQSLSALIASRLDQLAAAAKRLAQHAAVVGSAFWPRAVEHLEQSDEAVEPRLDELERRDLVRRSGATTLAGELEYLFKHILIRDVAYGQLPKRRRAVLHARLAEWIEALPGGADEFTELVAYHLEQACRHAAEVARPEEPPPIDGAVAALIAAAEKAERREGLREADRFYARALELIDDDRLESKVDLELRRSRILVAQGELKKAHTLLDRVAAEALTVDRPGLRASALVSLANIDWKEGGAGDWRGRLAEAVRIASATGDRALQVRVEYESAYLRAWFDGTAEDAVEEIKNALAIAEELGDRTLRIEGHMRLGSLLVNLGQLADADANLERCVELASDMGSFRDEARATSMLGFVKYYRGEQETAERLAAQALDWLERTCDSHLQIQNLRELARYALARNELEAAELRLREALQLALEGGGYLVVEIYRYLVETLVRQDRLDDAKQLVAFAARDVPEEDAYAQAALLLAEATVAAAADERSTATASFTQALQLLEQQQLLIDLAEARVVYARALAAFGETLGAQTELERARATFARIGARGFVEQIDSELAVVEGAG